MVSTVTDMLCTQHACPGHLHLRIMVSSSIQGVALKIRGSFAVHQQLFCQSMHLRDGLLVIRPAPCQHSCARFIHTLRRFAFPGTAARVQPLWPCAKARCQHERRAVDPKCDDKCSMPDCSAAYALLRRHPGSPRPSLESAPLCFALHFWTACAHQRRYRSCSTLCTSC